MFSIQFQQQLFWISFIQSYFLEMIYVAHLVFFIVVFLTHGRQLTSV